MLLPDPDESPAHQLISMMLEDLLYPSARTQQKEIGPSGLGNPCDHCLAEDMQKILPGHVVRRDEPGLAAIIGTGLHYYMEGLLIGERWDDIRYQSELSGLHCADIDNYGPIYGTADAYALSTVVDFKFSGVKRITHYKNDGIPIDYAYQRQFYGRGVRNLGLPVRQVANLFIPRDSNDPKKIWWDVVDYDENMCIAAERRANTIWNEFVLAGKADELGSDDDCYTCNNIFPDGELIFDE